MVEEVRFLSCALQRNVRAARNPHMSRNIDSPFAQFFGDLIGGHFSLFEEQGDEKREKAL